MSEGLARSGASRRRRGVGGEIAEMRYGAMARRRSNPDRPRDDGRGEGMVGSGMRTEEGRTRGGTRLDRLRMHFFFAAKLLALGHNLPTCFL